MAGDTYVLLVGKALALRTPIGGFLNVDTRVIVFPLYYEFQGCPLPDPPFLENQTVRVHFSFFFFFSFLPSLIICCVIKKKATGIP